MSEPAAPKSRAKASGRITRPVRGAISAPTSARARRFSAGSSDAARCTRASCSSSPGSPTPPACQTGPVARRKETPRLAAVLLTGGTAGRMDGVDKGALSIEGVTLLERALAAVTSAVEVGVVGPPAPTSRPGRWALEDPPRGGPAAGLLAGLDRLGSAPDLVAVLAVDMPRVTAATVRRLAAAVG